jgi:MraZ protein
MADFIGTHHGKLDGKGRMSVPVSFRNELKLESRSGNTAPTAPSPLYLLPSRKLVCIEARTEKGFDALKAELSKMARLGDEYHDLATAFFADSIRLEADKEGRIVLPADLIAHAELKPEGPITVMGIGDTFEIWDVEAAARRKAEARKKAAEVRFSSPGVTQ